MLKVFTVAVIVGDIIAAEAYWSAAPHLEREAAGKQAGALAFLAVILIANGIVLAVTLKSARAAKASAAPAPRRTYGSPFGGPR